MSSLSEEQRRRGRRLAYVSHPAGMTHRLVYTEQLPTLALVDLGASEAVVGLQRAFEPVGQLLQLPTLRLVGRYRKRSILIFGQAAAVVAGLPLVAWATLSGGRPGSLQVVLVSLALTAAAVVVGGTVWFPLLRGYVEPQRIGRFFGILRSGWHLVLIVYFLAARWWLEHHPGSFGPLFGLATVGGLLRIALIIRLPEARGERGERIRASEALQLLRRHGTLRRYLLGMSLAGASRRAVVPFVIVLMRRELGLGDDDVALATAASFAGGFVSLYLWGRLVDRLGSLPVFALTAFGTATLFAGLASGGSSTSAGVMTGFFFLLAVLSAGFGVADTNLLFALAPEHAPSRMLVVATVVTSLAYGAAPFAAGLMLDVAVRAGVAPALAYQTLFALAAGATLSSLLPLRAFRVR